MEEDGVLLSKAESLKLQAFHFLIEHRKGSENVVADMLSRVVEEVNVEENDEILGFESTVFESPEYKEFREDVETKKDMLPDVKVVDGFIFKRTQIRNDGSDAEENSWMLWSSSERL